MFRKMICLPLFALTLTTSAFASPVGVDFAPELDCVVMGPNLKNAAIYGEDGIGGYINLFRDGKIGSARSLRNGVLIVERNSGAPLAVSLVFNGKSDNHYSIGMGIGVVKDLAALENADIEDLAFSSTPMKGHADPSAARSFRTHANALGTIIYQKGYNREAMLTLTDAGPGRDWTYQVSCTWHKNMDL